MRKISILLLTALLLSACQTTPKIKDQYKVDLKSPSFPIGEVEAQFGRLLVPGLRKLTTNITYYPIEDAVCMQWRMDMINYRIFWHKETRETFIDAFEKYKEDFDARNFKGNSNRRLYGTSPAYVIWQLSANSTRAESESTIDFGFAFIERSPYFTATQREAENLNPEDLQQDYRVLAVLPIYFTRAQAGKLIEFFDSELLRQAAPVIPTKGPDADIYYDDDEDEPAESAEPAKPDTASEKDEY